eukprot:7574203-Karenia_brevis.AAC.1
MRARLLRKPENRRAPRGFHSCTSSKGIEVMVYENHHACPAYVFEYKCPSLFEQQTLATWVLMHVFEGLHAHSHNINVGPARHLYGLGLRQAREARRCG